MNRTTGSNGRVRFQALIFALAMTACRSAFGQGATAGTTPPAIAPGTPAGSYALSGFDTISLYSGKVNFLVPLHSIGGRGEAGYNVELPVQRNWTIIPINNGDGTVSFLPSTAMQASDAFIGDSPYRYLGPGFLTFRYAPDPRNASPVACTGDSPLLGKTIVSPGGLVLTRATWTGSDGTETELVDQLTGGQELAQPFDCTGTGNAESRGTVFVSTDGSSLTYVSNAKVFDQMYDQNASPPADGGYLFFPNGVRYTISSGFVTQIRDRNGNEVSIPFLGTSATDALGRTTTLNYASFPNGTTLASDTIGFTGFNNATRNVTVNYGLLSATLAPGQNLLTYACLFPELNGSTGTQFNPYIVTSIVLPNNQSYSFLYTSYGEVAQVTLPTGGTIQYTYGGAVANTTGFQLSTGSCAIAGDGSSGVVGGTDPAAGGTIQRRLITRKVLPSGPSGAIEQWTNYSADLSGPNTIVTVQHKNSIGSTVISQEKHYFFQNPLNPILDATNPDHYTPWQEGKEYQTDLLNASGQVLRSVTNTFTQRPCAAFPNDVACWFVSDPLPSPNLNNTTKVSGQLAPTHYAAITETDTTLSDTQQVSKSTFAYDQYNNRSDTYAYDYDGTLLRHTNRSFLTSNNGTSYDTINGTTPPASIHLRDLLSTEIVTDKNANVVSQTSITYDQGSITDYGSLPNHDSSYTSSYTTRGNATSVQRPVGGGSSPISTQAAYDIVGNVVTATDGNGHNTSLTFTTPDYAFAKTVSKSVGGTTMTWSRSYDESSSQVFTGQVTGFTDPNNNVTSYSAGSDPLDRLVLVTQPNQGRTQFGYDDADRIITTQTDQVTQDARLVSQTLFDGVGRQLQTRTFEDSNTAGNNYISTENTFDPLGRLYQASMPHRYVQTPTCGASTHCTTTSYDALNRPTSVATDDGSMTSSTYSGNTSTVTDPQGNIRSSTMDAAGRLTSITEDGTVTTNYQYNASDDLLAVCQAGSFSGLACTNGEGRQFTYDLVSRLTSATNPEAIATNSQTLNSVLYTQYDGNGNLLSKTDPRGIVTTITYDELDRPLTKTYTDGMTPAVTYCYDGKVVPAGGGACASSVTAIPNAVGHLIQTYTSGSSTTYTGFDTMGRVIASTQQTVGGTYQFGTVANPGYLYDLAGELISETYPSGRQVAFDYDPAGRTAHVKNAATGGVTYADLSLFNPAQSQFAYAPHGTIQTMTLGNNVVESWTWDPVRLQPNRTQIGSLLTLQYSYCPGGASSCSSNNGNMYQQVITTPTLGTLTQTYAYTDGFNRLTQATESQVVNNQVQQTWQQTFQYDNFGNRAMLSGYASYPSLTPGSLAQFDGHNHWSGAGYDAAGNTTSLPQQTFTYDAENRVISSAQSGIGAIAYGYDGDGRRVMKTVGSSTTAFVYDASGKLVAEYGEPTDSGTTYLSVDHLGSTRLLQRSSGLQYYDYAPFGEDLHQGIGGRGITYVTGVYPANPDLQSAKFTGKERDSETGLDFFGARYFSGAMGRFTSPDPEIIPRDISDPQAWNKYAYTLNNPLKNVDPDGRETLPAVVQQMLEKYAPTALSAASKSASDVGIVMHLLDFEHSMGLFPAMQFPGPGTSSAEREQGRQVAAMTGNDILHVDDNNNQGFDAFQVKGSIFNIQGLIPTELKGLVSDNPYRVLAETLDTEKAANGVTLPGGNKLTGVQMFIFAPNMNANAVAGFAKNGPLPSIVGRSSVEKVVVRTGNGTITIQNKQVTVKCKKTAKDGTCQ